jgi:autotransporter-associated beta strand protein
MPAVVIVSIALTLFWPTGARAGDPVDWDPSATAGIQGGSGVWDTTKTNWNAGAANVKWNNLAGDTPVFGGAASGNVQVTSNVVAAGIQFDLSGYQLTPASSARTLTLSAGAIAANADAAITQPLTLPAGLTKSGAGTLTLSADNAPVAGTTISVTGGVLAFSAESNLGPTSVDLNLAGGTLRYTSAAALSLGGGTRHLGVAAAGGAFDTGAATVTLTGAAQLAGAGELNKLGNGTLTLSAANTTFAGALRVSAGTVNLSNAAALNGRPITLATGAHLTIRSTVPRAPCGSALTVSGDAAVDLAQSANPDPTYYPVMGDLSVAAGTTLTVGATAYGLIEAAGADLSGGLRLNNAGVRVTGALSGSGGGVTFGPASHAPETFTLGLLFANGAAQTFAGAVSAADPSVSRLVVGSEGAGTSVTYAGTWAAGGAANQSYVMLRGGGAFALGAAARVNTVTADLAAARPLTVIGDGAANTFELAAGFVADHTAAGTAADGLASLEVRDATLVTRSTAGLPVATLQDGSGGTHRAGSVTLAGTTATSTWVVATDAQTYDGGVTIASSATIRTDADLAHAGTTAAKFDGQFQIPAAGVTLTKAGPARLTLAGHQGYAPGAAMNVTAGTLRFDTDPGAGYFSGNYTRGADGNVAVAPTPAGALAVTVGGAPADAPVTEFAAPVARVASLAVNAGGVARLVATPALWQHALVTGALAVTGTGRLDLGDGTLVLDYTGPAVHALADVAALVKGGFNAPGPRWQGAGVASATAAADPDALAVGFAEASDVLELAGNQTATFAGAAVDATAVLARLTRVGDANLDGVVDFADFQRLQLGFGRSGATWSSGDFNYDGAVDRMDVGLLYFNYGESVPTTFDLPATAGAVDGVPEPASLGLIGVAASVIGHRRRARCPA